MYGCFLDHDGVLCKASPVFSLSINECNRDAEETRWQDYKKAGFHTMARLKSIFPHDNTCTSGTPSRKPYLELLSSDLGESRAVHIESDGHVLKLWQQICAMQPSSLGRSADISRSSIRCVQ